MFKRAIFLKAIFGFSKMRPSSLIHFLSFVSAIPWGEDTDWNYWFGTVKKGAKTGKENGFSVLFDIESFDYGYYDEGSEGLKVRSSTLFYYQLTSFLCENLDNFDSLKVVVKLNYLTLTFDILKLMEKRFLIQEQLLHIGSRRERKAWMLKVNWRCVTLYSMKTVSICLQVAIVHHLDMPIMRQRAFHIAPGTENQIPITPTLYTANPQVIQIMG